MTLTELKTLHSQAKAKSGQSYSAKDSTGKILYFVGTAEGRLKELTSFSTKSTTNSSTSTVSTTGSSLETDPIFTAWLATPPNVSLFTNDAGYITSATGTTNLGYIASPTDGIVTSDTGTDATLPLADTTNAGLLSPGDKLKLNNTSGTNTGDQNLAPYLLISTAASTYQPLDSDLTAIAALTTDSFGRDLLTKTSGANVRSYIGAGTGNGDALTTNPLSQFASTTSAQLAGVLSDETGTGAAVFANSPTLVTPALGTPSALVLTNATALPAAQISVGALSNGITATTQSANDNSTKLATTAYTDRKLMLYQLGSNTATVANSGTYYFGNVPNTNLNSTAKSKLIGLVAGGIISSVTMTFYSANPGTTVITFGIDIVTSGGSTTNLTLGSQALTVTNGFTVVNFTGLSQAVNATDRIEGKFVLAGSGTAPTTVYPTAVVGIQ